MQLLSWLLRKDRFMETWMPFLLNRVKPVSILEEEKYIMFESQLVSLFNTCTFYLSKRVTVVKVRPKYFGSQLKIEATCENCNHRQEWYSQPGQVGESMADRQHSPFCCHLVLGW